MNIIFGSKRLGQTVEKAVNEKYPNQAVVTVEGQKEAKKSRRILFNTKAAELLGLEAGSVQEIVFGSLETGEVSGKKVLVMNLSASGQEAGDMKVYKTSKNKVSYSDSKEKGKAITSSHMCAEVFSFLGKNDQENVEFVLNVFNSDEIEAFELCCEACPKDQCIDPECDTHSCDATSGVIETNNGEMTAQDVTESVQDQVARDEELDPIFKDESPEVAQDNIVSEDW